ncbi:MAG: hypothetical protein MJ252_28735 [archaeon]|nr:hypothetical protein [archaeon]
MILSEIISLFKQQTDFIAELFSTYENLSDSITCKNQIISNLSMLHKEKIKNTLSKFLDKFGKTKGNHFFNYTTIIHMEDFTLNSNNNIIHLDGTGFESFGNNGFMNINSSNHNTNNSSNHNTNNSKPKDKKEKNKITVSLKNRSNSTSNKKEIPTDYGNNDLIENNIKYFNILNYNNTFNCKSTRNFFGNQSENEGTLMKNYSGRFAINDKDSENDINKNSNTISLPNSGNKNQTNRSNSVAKIEHKKKFKNVKKIRTSSFINKGKDSKIPKPTSQFQLSSNTPSKNYLLTHDSYFNNNNNYNFNDSILNSPSYNNILTQTTSVNSSLSSRSNAIKYKRMNKSAIGQFLNMPETTTSTSSMDQMSYSNFVNSNLQKKKRSLSQSFESSYKDFAEELRNEYQPSLNINNTSVSNCTVKSRVAPKNKRSHSCVRGISSERVKEENAKMRTKNFYKNIKKVKSKYSDFINISNKNISEPRSTNNVGNEENPNE